MDTITMERGLKNKFNDLLDFMDNEDIQIYHKHNQNGVTSLIVATAQAQTEAVEVLTSKNASFTLTCDNAFLYTIRLCLGLKA